MYTEYHFQPTTTFFLKGKKVWWFVIVLLFILFLYSLGVGYELLFVFGLSRGDAVYAFLGGIGAIVAIISCGLILKCYKRTKPIKIENIADYIEGIAINKRYSMIVKNGLWGLYDTKNHKVQIPCEYDYLTWVNNGSILRASKGNKNSLIDIYNKTLK